MRFSPIADRLARDDTQAWNVHRLASEPLRLGPRYVRHNFWFLFYHFWDGARGKAWKCAPVSSG